MKKRSLKRSQAAHARLAARYDQKSRVSHDDHLIIIGAYHRQVIKKQSSLGRILTDDEKQKTMRSVESSWYN